MPMELGEVERRIVAELQKDARLSMRELATRVGVSTPTASAKVKQLESMGLIRGYRVDLDPSLLPGADHVLEVEATPGETPNVAAGLGRIEGVSDVVATEGDRVFARHAGASDGLVRALSRLAGVRGYKLHPIVGAAPPPEAAPAPPPAPASPSHAPAVAPKLALNVACHECGGPITGAGIHKRWELDGLREHWFCCRNCAAQFGKKLESLSKKVERSPK